MSSNCPYMFCQSTPSSQNKKSIYIDIYLCFDPHATKELDGVPLDKGPVFAPLDIGNETGPGEVEVVGEKARQIQLQ